MQPTFVSQLIQTLSAERLNAYRGRLPQAAPDLQLFGRYAWNIALCESLYPSVQMLEVALRNTIHQAATQHFKRTDWFDTPGVLQQFHERDAVTKAKAALTLHNKPLDAHRIVAELTFGFWTSLLDRRYEQILWPPLLKDAFPYMPRKHRTRANLSKRFHTMRQLRNRIFHHEPIAHWRDLARQHGEIVEAIAWIAPAAKDLVQAIDRFPTVHAQGTAPIEQTLRTFC